MVTTERIDGVILNQLARGEMRILILLVSVRKALAGSAPFKGDLPKAVNTALRRLVASRSVTDNEGVYSLVRAKVPA